MLKNSEVICVKEFCVGEKVFNVGYKMKYITRLRTGVNVLKDLSNNHWLELSDETLKNFEQTEVKNANN